MSLIKIFCFYQPFKTHYLMESKDQKNSIASSAQHNAEINPSDVRDPTTAVTMVNVWTITQTQIEGLLCEQYSQMFAEICNENKSAEFAEDARVSERVARINENLSQLAAGPQTWPNQITPLVRLYTPQQEYSTGIVLGPSSLIFSWPQQYEGTNPIDNLNVMASQSEACRVNSQVQPLVTGDFPLGQYLTGKLIGDIMEVFEMTFLVALGFPAFADAFNANPKESAEYLRLMFTKYKTTLITLGDPPVAIPDNLQFEFDSTNSEYVIKHAQDGDGNSQWTLVLPMQPVEDETGAAPSSLRYQDPNRRLRGCQSPCLEFRGKFFTIPDFL